MEKKWEKIEITFVLHVQLVARKGLKPPRVGGRGGEEKVNKFIWRLLKKNRTKL